MSRILPVIASFSIILMVLAATFGLTMGNLYVQPRPEHTLLFARLHFLIGLLAALAVVLVECIVVTYFIGTSRWCKEVAETYRLNMEPVQASNRLKRRAFPWALAGMFAVIAIISLGGASDPGTGQHNTKDWATWHLCGAFLGIAFIAWTYFVAWNNVVANQRIINNMLEEVARIRGEANRALQASKG